MNIPSFNVAVIGAGAMGSAVARGLLAAGYDPQNLTVANPHEAKLAPFAKAGCRVTTDNIRAISGAGLVIIAVKPWILPQVTAELKEHIDASRQEVALIVAGIGADRLKEMMSGERPAAPLSVVMPNTAVALGQSMTFIVKIQPPCTKVEQLFERLGTLMEIEERMLPAATALASCGIAYALRYVRAAVEGGVELGFRAADAQQIVAQTIAGAAALLREPGAHAESEIDKVTTPGGFTIRGLNAMESAGFTSAVIAGLKASVK